jgi:molecular chaperone DnaK (HSP70)
VNHQVRLAIDIGAIGTVAVLGYPDGKTVPVPFDDGWLLPPGVFAEDETTLLVGAEAQRRAVDWPDRFEPSPLRRVDEGHVLHGHAEFSVEQLFVAVLSRAHATAVRVVGGPVSAVVLSVPAAWGRQRRAILASAAAAAGLPG